MIMNKKMVVVHCADTYARMDIGADDIDKWHRGRGWDAIGYNFVIRRSGVLEPGRDLDGDGDVLEERGAHAAGFNSTSVGICLVGGKGDDGSSEANFTIGQMTTLRTLLNVLKVTLNDPEILGHCDLPGVLKKCPCFDVREWFETGVL